MGLLDKAREIYEKAEVVTDRAKRSYKTPQAEVEASAGRISKSREIYRKERDSEISHELAEKRRARVAAAWESDKHTLLGKLSVAAHEFQKQQARKAGTKKSSDTGGRKRKRRPPRESFGFGGSGVPWL